jgi:DNA polymerase I-like protein with 3'-5' exonuclease and polymerase domains
LEEIINLITKIMEEIYTLKVPLKVNVKIGSNWGELQ